MLEETVARGGQDLPHLDCECGQRNQRQAENRDDQTPWRPVLTPGRLAQRRRDSTRGSEELERIWTQEGGSGGHLLAQPGLVPRGELLGDKGVPQQLDVVLGLLQCGPGSDRHGRQPLRLGLELLDAGSRVGCGLRALVDLSI